MAKFFEKLVDRFFDFFNMGRLLTIFVPGVLAACCISMLMSQLIFPIALGSNVVNQPPADASKPAANAKAAKKQPEIGAAVKAEIKAPKARSGGSGPKQRMAAALDMADQLIEQVEAETLSAFAGQVRSDFQKLIDHPWLIMLLSVMSGFPIYEIGYRLLSNRASKLNANEVGLYPYSDRNDPAATKKLFSLGKAAPDPTKPVGIMYFAPFLKEKFSGQENYFDFLVTEFYRFQEFSMVMPVSIVLSSTLAFLYYALFSVRQGVWASLPLFAFVYVSVAASAVIYYRTITKPGLEDYARSKKALVQGVSAMLSKGLAKQG